MNFRVLLVACISQILMLNASCQKADTTGLSNEEFTKIAQTKNASILDVRTTDEFKAGHIENAVNIDILEINAFRKYVSKLDKERTYLLYCRSGKRSANALKIMNELGFPHVKHLQNGITGWDGKVIK